MLTLSPDDLLARLEEAARDLLFPSESDFPLTPFRWDGSDPSPEALRILEGAPDDMPVETTTVADLFAPVLAPDPSDARAQADAARYRALVDLLEQHLADLRAYRVGRVDIDVYVLGRHVSGAWLGLKTKVVET